MKFSDMMGKGDATATSDDVVTEATTETPVETAPEVAAAPIQFGGVRTGPEPAAAIAAPAVEPVEVTPPKDFELRDLVAELAPSDRMESSVANDEELDATSWLEGLSSIDDDLLPH